MKLAELQVLHLDGEGKPSAAELAQLRALGRAWVTDTCQRTVIVAAGREAATRLAARAPALSGTEAYAFLLRFACGLESRMAGETEVFGQIKASWRDFCGTPSVLSRQLDTWVQLLFKDTKAIRAAHLSNLGSASYGSQVRRLLGEATDGPTLLVGAGQLALAVAPWLESSELLLWNRTPDRARELARRVQERHPERACRVLDGGLKSELDAWSRAGDVIVCVPPDQTRDAARIAAWGTCSGRRGQIVHLGLGEVRDSIWAGVPGLTSLSALYDMLRTQSDLRSLQLAHARRSCAEQALQRSLGQSAAPTHGWEDLGAFATISP
jgi:hypothetical protein